MERYIERVKKSINAKEPPLKLAETRLSKRTKVLLQTLLRITRANFFTPLSPVTSKLQSKPIFRDYRFPTISSPLWPNNLDILFLLITFTIPLAVLFRASPS